MISAAELPLNDRGAVYHLNLRPEELADVIITVGDPDRVPLFSKHFDSIEFKREHREFATHTGYIGKKRLSVVSTGIGVPSIDIVMNELDALANIDLTSRTPKAIPKRLTIIRLGTSGSLQTDTQPGEILISRFAIGFDTLLDYYQSQPTPDMVKLETKLKAYLGTESSAFYLSEADSELISYVTHVGTIGITATCDGFYGPQGRMLRVPLRYPNLLDRLNSFQFQDLKVLNFEMETAAMMGLGRLMGHRCLSLSVAVANRLKGSFSTNIIADIEAFIVSALQAITKL